MKPLIHKAFAILLCASTLLAQAGFLAEGFSCAHDELVSTMACCSASNASCQMPQENPVLEDCCAPDLTLIQYGSLSIGQVKGFDFQPPVFPFTKVWGDILPFVQQGNHHLEAFDDPPSAFPSLQIAFQSFLI